MKVIILLAIVGACIAQRSNPAAMQRQAAELPDSSKWTPFICRDGILGPDNERLAEIGPCPPECQYSCQAKGLGLLNADGKPSVETYNKFVEATLPEHHQKLASAWFNDCFQKYGKFIDLSDKECKMAKLFGDCTWEVQPQLTCPK